MNSKESQANSHGFPWNGTPNQYIPVRTIINMSTRVRMSSYTYHVKLRTEEGIATAIECFT